MDLLRIAVRVAATPSAVPEDGGGDMGEAKQGVPMKSDVSWYEGGSYSPEDIVGGLPQFDGPVWAGFHSFGWIIVDRDPATIADDEVLQGDEERTWGEVKAHEDLKGGLEDMKPYPSMAAFAADDQTIRWMCSYDDAERDGIQEALLEHGWTEAAARVPDVEF